MNSNEYVKRVLYAHDVRLGEGGLHKLFTYLRPLDEIVEQLIKPLRTPVFAYGPMGNNTGFYPDEPHNPYGKATFHIVGTILACIVDSPLFTARLNWYEDARVEGVVNIQSLEEAKRVARDLQTFEQDPTVGMQVPTDLALRAGVFCMHVIHVMRVLSLGEAAVSHVSEGDGGGDSGVEAAAFYNFIQETTAAVCELPSINNAKDQTLFCTGSRVPAGMAADTYCDQLNRENGLLRPHGITYKPLYAVLYDMGVVHALLALKGQRAGKTCPPGLATLCRYLTALTQNHRVLTDVRKMVRGAPEHTELSPFTFAVDFDSLALSAYIQPHVDVLTSVTGMRFGNKSLTLEYSGMDAKKAHRMEQFIVWCLVYTMRFGFVDPAVGIVVPYTRNNLYKAQRANSTVLGAASHTGRMLPSAFFYSKTPKLAIRDAVHVADINMSTAGSPLVLTSKSCEWMSGMQRLRAVFALFEAHTKGRRHLAAGDLATVRDTVDAPGQMCRKDTFAQLRDAVGGGALHADVLRAACAVFEAENVDSEKLAVLLAPAVCTHVLAKFASHNPTPKQVIAGAFLASLAQNAPKPAMDDREALLALVKPRLNSRTHATAAEILESFSIMQGGGELYHTGYVNEDPDVMERHLAGVNAHLAAPSTCDPENEIGVAGPPFGAYCANDYCVLKNNLCIVVGVDAEHARVEDTADGTPSTVTHDALTFVYRQRRVLCTHRGYYNANAYLKFDWPLPYHLDPLPQKVEHQHACFAFQRQQQQMTGLTGENTEHQMPNKFTVQNKTTRPALKHKWVDSTLQKRSQHHKNAVGGWLEPPVSTPVITRQANMSTQYGDWVLFRDNNDVYGWKRKVYTEGSLTNYTDEYFKGREKPDDSDDSSSDTELTHGFAAMDMSAGDWDDYFDEDKNIWAWRHKINKMISYAEDPDADGQAHQHQFYSPVQANDHGSSVNKFNDAQFGQASYHVPAESDLNTSVYVDASEDMPSVVTGGSQSAEGAAAVAVLDKDRLATNTDLHNPTDVSNSIKKVLFPPSPTISDENTFTNDTAWDDLDHVAQYNVLAKAAYYHTYAANTHGVRVGDVVIMSGSVGIVRDMHVRHHFGCDQVLENHDDDDDSDESDSSDEASPVKRGIRKYRSVDWYGKYAANRVGHEELKNTEFSRVKREEYVVDGDTFEAYTAIGNLTADPTELIDTFKITPSYADVAKVVRAWSGIDLSVSAGLTQVVSAKGYSMDDVVGVTVQWNDTNETSSLESLYSRNVTPDQYEQPEDVTVTLQFYERNIFVIPCDEYKFATNDAINYSGIVTVTMQIDGTSETSRRHFKIDKDESIIQDYGIGSEAIDGLFTAYTEAAQNVDTAMRPTQPTQIDGVGRAPLSNLIKKMQAETAIECHREVLDSPKINSNITICHSALKQNPVFDNFKKAHNAFNRHVAVYSPPTLLKRTAYVFVTVPHTALGEGISSALCSIDTHAEIEALWRKGYAIGTEPVVRKTIPGRHVVGDYVVVTIRSNHTDPMDGTREKMIAAKILELSPQGEIAAVDTLLPFGDEKVSEETTRWYLIGADVQKMCVHAHRVLQKGNPIVIAEADQNEPEKNERELLLALKQTLKALDSCTKDQAADLKQVVGKLMTTMASKCSTLLGETQITGYRRHFVYTAFMLDNVLSALKGNSISAAHIAVASRRFKSQEQWRVSVSEGFTITHVCTMMGVRNTETLSPGQQCTPETTARATVINRTVRLSHTYRSLPQLWGAISGACAYAVAHRNDLAEFTREIGNDTELQELRSAAEAVYDEFKVTPQDPVRLRVNGMSQKTMGMACLQSVYPLLVESVRSPVEKSTVAYATLLNLVAGAEENVSETVIKTSIRDGIARTPKVVFAALGGALAHGLQPLPSVEHSFLVYAQQEERINSTHTQTKIPDMDVSPPTTWSATQPWVPPSYRRHVLTGTHSRAGESMLLMAHIVHMLVDSLPEMLRHDPTMARLHTAADTNPIAVDFTALLAARPKLACPRGANVIRHLYCHNVNLLAQIVQIVNRANTPGEKYKESATAFDTALDTSGYAWFAVQANPYSYPLTPVPPKEKLLTQCEEDAVVMYIRLLVNGDTH